MKLFKTVLLALSFFGPLAISGGMAHAQPYDCFESEALEAACGLMNNARQARNMVNGLAAQDPNTDLRNAARYSGFIANQGDILARMLAGYASDEEIQTQLEYIRNTVLQLDATKRKLKTRYPSNYALTSALTSVRTTYFYLEGLLFPED